MHVAVIGASLAGLRAVEALRREGFDGRVTLVGAEAHLPYDRPPLSKQILRGEWTPEHLDLRRDDWESLELDLRLSTRARALDAVARQVTLDDGSVLAVDRLLIATGARARAFPGRPASGGVFVLRTLDDALALRSALEKRPRVAVIGAGFIGAEVAASCRELGLDVSMVEPLPVPLARGLGPQMGGLVAALHRDRGVDLRCGVAVAAIEGAGRVEQVRLSDGSVLPADVVVVGIGVEPETRWLEGSGLVLRDGVVCDAQCRAAPGIFAAGDVARWHNPLFDEDMRVEHWTNAVEQGVYAAGRLLEAVEPAATDPPAEPFAPVPMFWSDQYGVKIQFAGRAREDDSVVVVSGSPDEGRFVALYGRGGRLTGALAFNNPRRLIAWRQQIAARIGFEEALALEI